MNWLFGRSKPKTDPNKAINDMKDKIELLQKRERLLQNKIEKEEEMAKNYVKKGNKNAALMCLKRKKSYEQQIQKINGQIMNIETVMLQLEQSTMDMDAFEAQKTGAKALQNIFKQTNPDKIDKEMDKVRDAMDNAKEISDMISQPFGDTIDDDELNEELNQLEAEELDKKMLGIDDRQTTTIPSGNIEVPKQTEAKKTPTKSEVEDELAALEAEMTGWMEPDHPTRIKYPRNVWAPTGGWYALPSNWKRNTAIAFIFAGVSSYFVFRLSASKERRKIPPLKPIPSQKWSKYAKEDDPRLQ